MPMLGSTLLKKTAAAETDQPMLTPEQVVEQLRAIQAQIPEFVQLPENNRTKLMKRWATVNVEFSREAINTVGASEVVRNTVGNTPEEFHQAENEVARWTAVESELQAMLRGVKAANVVRRHRIGLAALQVFNVSRELARREEHADLLPRIEAMRRIPKYLRRPAKPPATPDPAKQPQQPATKPA